MNRKEDRLVIDDNFSEKGGSADFWGRRKTGE